MISQREIERKYNELLKKVQTDDYYKVDLSNRVNCYVCTSCSHVTKTIDIDPGVTPFMIRCEKCKDISHSRFYNDVAPYQKPTIEWFRPTLKECLKYRKKQYGEEMLEHIFNGGLEKRKRKNEK